MKQVKAKFYPETKEIVILETIRPSLIELEEKPKRHPLNGTDEKGDWVLVDYVHDKETYYDYTVENIKDKDGNILTTQAKQKRIGADEWQQT